MPTNTRPPVVTAPVVPAGTTVVPGVTAPKIEPITVPSDDPGLGFGAPAGETVVTDTDTDSDTDSEVDESDADPVAAAAAATPKTKMERFLEGEAPEWLDELQTEEAGALSLSDEEFDALPIQAKTLLAALAQRGKAAQATVAARQEAERIAAEALRSRETRAQDLEADAFKWARDPSLQAFVEKLKPTGPVPDPDSPEGLKYVVDSMVAKQLGEWHAAIQAADARQTAATEAARAAAATEARVAQFKGYIEKNAEDFKDPVILGQIRALLDETKGTLTPERAHQLVMAQLIGQVAVKPDDRAAALEQARRSVKPSGRAGRVIPTMPDHIRGDVDAELDWYAVNPEAEARDAAEAQKRASYRNLARQTR